MAYSQPGLAGLFAPIISRSDLQYRYDWTAAAEHDNARITGFPDDRLLARHEGYEVLPFLNRFCQINHYPGAQPPLSKADGLKAERLIQTVLPGDIRSHARVNQWLIENWAKF